jgi:hypothetical protein
MRHHSRNESNQSPFHTSEHPLDPCWTFDFQNAMRIKYPFRIRQQETIDTCTETVGFSSTSIHSVTSFLFWQHPVKCCCHWFVYVTSNSRPRRIDILLAVSTYPSCLVRVLQIKGVHNDFETICLDKGCCLTLIWLLRSQ